MTAVQNWAAGRECPGRYPARMPNLSPDRAAVITAATIALALASVALAVLPF
jgi:hypothetical protein